MRGSREVFCDRLQRWRVVLALWVQVLLFCSGHGLCGSSNRRIQLLIDLAQSFLDWIFAGHWWRHDHLRIHDDVVAGLLRIILLRRFHRACTLEPHLFELSSIYLLLDISLQSQVLVRQILNDLIDVLKSNAVALYGHHFGDEFAEIILAVHQNLNGLFQKNGKLFPSLELGIFDDDVHLFRVSLQLNIHDWSLAVDARAPKFHWVVQVELNLWNVEYLPLASFYWLKEALQVWLKHLVALYDFVAGVRAQARRPSHRRQCLGTVLGPLLIWQERHFEGKLHLALSEGWRIFELLEVLLHYVLGVLRILWLILEESAVHVAILRQLALAGHVLLKSILLLNHVAHLSSRGSRIASVDQLPRAWAAALLWWSTKITRQGHVP